MKDRKLHLPYLLAALAGASFEGSLGLCEGDARRILYFHKGRLTNVVSGLQEETLGRVLMDEGALSPAQYAELLGRMLQSHRPCGEVLVTMGALTFQGVFAALERQVAKKLFRCFRMVDFGFELKAEPVPIQQLITTTEISQVLYPAILDGYTSGRLVQEFPVHEETRFTQRPLPACAALHLGPRETRVYRDIDQGVLLARLVRTQDNLKQILSALYTLHALWLIDASTVTRPSVLDLELAGLAEGWIGEQPITLPEGNADDRVPDPLAPDQTPDEPVPDADAGDRMSTCLARKTLSISRADHFTLLEIDRQVKGQALKNAYFRVLRTYRLQAIDKSYSSAQDREMAGALLDRVTIAYRELQDEQSRKEYVAALQTSDAPQERSVPTRILADVEAQKGDLALHARQYEEAAQFFRKAINLHPDEPSYHFFLGLIGWKRLGENLHPDDHTVEDIRRNLQKALKLNPHYDQPRLYLGYLAKRAGDLKEALREFKATLKINPENTLAAAEIRHLNRKRKHNPD